MNKFVSNFTRLQSLKGVAGMCAALGSQVVANHLPISDRRTAELLRVVAQLVDAYTEVGREIGRFVLGFDGGIVMIVSRGDRRIVALTNGDAERERVIRAMEGFLESHLEFQVRWPSKPERLHGENLARPPLELHDEWGRKSISLQGLKAIADELTGDRGKPLPLPPLKVRIKKDGDGDIDGAPPTNAYEI